MSKSGFIPGVNPEAKPLATGCVECLEHHGSMWVHLRRCAECGHIGCCDDSPGRHARKHFLTAGHPIIQSFEPGEDWFYNFLTDEEVDTTLTLAPPNSHPESQPVPFFVK